MAAFHIPIVVAGEKNVSIPPKNNSDLKYWNLSENKMGKKEKKRMIVCLTFWDKFSDKNEESLNKVRARK